MMPTLLNSNEPNPRENGKTPLPYTIMYALQYYQLFDAYNYNKNKQQIPWYIMTSMSVTK